MAQKLGSKPSREVKAQSGYSWLKSQALSHGEKLFAMLPSFCIVESTP
jgi:hypothetical protein